jgi:hypothetical protein
MKESKREREKEGEEGRQGEETKSEMRRSITTDTSEIQWLLRNYSVQFYVKNPEN